MSGKHEKGFPMRSTYLALPFVAAVATAALAEDPAPAPAAIPQYTITGGATIITDYRFRGISQTNKRTAVQGTIGIAHVSGFYVGTWGSSIDDYVAAGSDQEIDLYFGYKKSFMGFDLDGGILYYYYPGNAKGSKTDFFEPYLNASKIYGPVGVKLGLNWAFKQHALNYGVGSAPRESNLYTYGELSAGVPKTPLTVTGHIGESWGRSYRTAGLKRYTDWSVTAAFAYKALTASLAYVDTDARKRQIVSPNRDIANGGVVFGIGVAF